MSDSSNSSEKEMVARIVIEKFSDGSLKFESNLSDKTINYGLLQEARDSIFEFHLGKKAKNNGVSSSRIVKLFGG